MKDLKKSLQEHQKALQAQFDELKVASQVLGQIANRWCIKSVLAMMAC